MYGWVIPIGNTFCMHSNKQLILMENLLALLFVHEKAAFLGAISFQCVALQWSKAAICMIAHV